MHDMAHASSSRRYLRQISAALVAIALLAAIGATAASAAASSEARQLNAGSVTRFFLGGGGTAMSEFPSEAAFRAYVASHGLPLPKGLPAECPQNECSEGSGTRRSPAVSPLEGLRLSSDPGRGIFWRDATAPFPYLRLKGGKSIDKLSTVKQEWCQHLPLCPTWDNEISAVRSVDTPTYVYTGEGYSGSLLVIPQDQLPQDLTGTLFDNAISSVDVV